MYNLRQKIEEKDLLLNLRCDCTQTACIMLITCTDAFAVRPMVQSYRRTSNNTRSYILLKIG